MEITFSKHALRKLKERKLDVSIVEKAVKEPTFIFYDLISRSMIAIAEIKIANTLTNLVVPHVKEKDNIRIITVYPCKDINREIRKKEGVRWIRVK
jgi:hypothetical protein